MATKYLARTIIEGGRARYSKQERNDSHREERALVRVFMAKASAQPEGFDALCIEPRGKVYKGFADKLGAPRRWLRAQIGPITARTSLYRQARRLNEDELERWHLMHEKARGKLSGPRERSA
jgi:hypothetical protein